MFKESDEQKAAKEEAWRAQQEVMERRRNPEKMAEYDAEVKARRMQGVTLFSFDSPCLLL